VPLHFRVRTLSGVGQSTERLLVLEPLDDEIFVGRYRGSQIELPLPAVSGRHARLWREGDIWQVQDLGSANGTFRNGSRLVPQRPEPLLVGDVLGVVGLEVVFEGEERAPDSPSQVESTHTLARRLVSDLFGACRPAEVPRLVCLDGNSEVLRLVSLGRCYSVGRGAACDLVLADEDVSRGHAELERRWDGVYLRDAGSKNGTLLDGRPVEQEIKLLDGAVLKFGRTQFRFEDPEEGYLMLLREAEAEVDAERVLPAVSETPPALKAPLASQLESPNPPPQSSVSSEGPSEPARDELSPPASTGRGRVPRPSSQLRPTLVAALAAVVLVAVAAIGISLLLGLWK
jgi:pSer/pThr/pTyr-binding forkhead associated (FHA) protein